MRPLSDGGYLMTIQEFRDTVTHNYFIDYDGFGYFATQEQEDETVNVWPSEFSRLTIPPEWATHVIWFNR